VMAHPCARHVSALVLLDTPNTISRIRAQHHMKKQKKYRCHCIMLRWRAQRWLVR
jgi:hypothetical protein